MIESSKNWPRMHSLPFSEKELVANLTPHSSHADEIALLAPGELEPRNRPAEDVASSGEAQIYAR
tara:strand:- start:336 stop:530 length:195 start_codon:yes stop_codon:yes gene_type:complete